MGTFDPELVQGDAVSLQSFPLSDTTPSDGDKLIYDGVSNKWEPVSETPLPRLTRASATSLTIAAWPGLSSTVKVLMPDGKVRTFSGTLTLDCTTTGENGLDTGSLAANTIYPTYLIPKSADDDLLVSMATATRESAGGPSGKSIYLYLGTFFIGAGGGILNFNQSDVATFTFSYPRYLDISDGGSSTTKQANPKVIQLLNSNGTPSFVSEYATSVNLLAYTHASAAGNMRFVVWENGFQSTDDWTNPLIKNANGGTDWTTQESIGNIPFNESTKKIAFQRQLNDMNVCTLEVISFIDGSLIHKRK